MATAERPSAYHPCSCLVDCRNQLRVVAAPEACPDRHPYLSSLSNAFEPASCKDGPQHPTSGAADEIEPDNSQYQMKHDMVTVEAFQAGI